MYIVYTCFYFLFWGNIIGSTSSFPFKMFCIFFSYILNKHVLLCYYVARFKGHINYYSGWKVKAISLEDQVFITLMKLKQNYTNLHLAQLFSCSVATVSNTVLIFVLSYIPCCLKT